METFIDPKKVVAALLSSVKTDETKVYMDQSILDARAKEVNAWREKLGKTTGLTDAREVNAWREKIGKTTGKKWFKSSGAAAELYSPAVIAAYASGDTSKADAILEALAADNRMESDRLAQIKATFLKKVGEAKEAPGIL